MRASPPVAYKPRDSTGQVLHQLVRDHFETFRAEAACLRHGEGLPRFVEAEFTQFLQCGALAAGFARFQCGQCRADRLVPFSCKGRGFCPSCLGRRMTARAAHLVDHVFPPELAVRQWVLSLPFRVRYLLAWDHALCRAVAGVFVRAVLGFLRRRLRKTGVVEGRSGAVVFIQRFGGALNLNVHFHALVLDGVVAQDVPGRFRFHRCPPLTTEEVADVLHRVSGRVARILVRQGLAGEDPAATEDPWAETAPVLAGLSAAAVRGVTALGPGRGAGPGRRGVARAVGTTEPPRGRAHAREDGYDLHAGLVIPAGQPDRLERLCRYVLRPPVTQDRLRLTADGQVLLQLRHPWRDGTTHLVFEPVAVLERLAALTPRPRINLVLYFGLLAPRAGWRDVVSRPAPGDQPCPPPSAEAAPYQLDARNPRWAALLQRSFGLDVLACPRCGGRLRLIALITQPAVVARILRHLGLDVERPRPRPARAPPPSQDLAP